MKTNWKFTVPYIITTLSVIGAISAVAESQMLASTDNTENKTKNINAETDSTLTAPSIMDIKLDSIKAAQARPSKVREAGRDVVYVCGNGDEITRKRGTRAWRNNNPGNLVYTAFTREQGAIGECGKYAVFPDEETGMNALRKLLESDSYRKLTIEAAIKRYDPSGASANALYLSKLKKLTGLPNTTQLCNLNREQLNMVADAIRKIEGWIEGTETRVNKNEPMMARTNVATMRDTLLREANVHSL